MASQSFSDAFGRITEMLGRGESVLLLAIDLIDEDPDNPRLHFDQAELAALADTIRRRGLLQPLTVRPQGADGRYRLRFGARRLRAARLAGLPEVRALVQADEADAAEDLVEQLIENDQREGLSTSELAQAVVRLRDLGLRQADIGRRIGRPPEQITMLASVRDMPVELRELAPHLGVRTLYELFGAWKADAGRTKVWLAGRDPASITQAAARELAGRPVPRRQVIRDPSDGSVRDTSKAAASAPPEALPAKASRGPDRPVDQDVPASAGATAVFEVQAPGITGTLVLENVRAPSAGVHVRLSDGSVQLVPAAKIKIVSVRPG